MKNNKEKQLLDLLLKLQNENYELKRILKQNNIPFNVDRELDSNSHYNTNQNNLIVERNISDYDVRYFYSLFWGRTDVYARRGKNGGYFPQCLNRWNNLCPIYCGKTKGCLNDCDNRKYAPLTKEIIYKHLLGNKDDCTDVIGIYPLHEDNTCRFIVFDFDNHDKNDNSNNWQEEVSVIRQICIDNDIFCLTERSRSGNGAHIWILFSEPIKATVARYFG